jgi:NAD(P)-dependent dehydrogenase (short-subunit alcohol dehydrogenase family)
MLAGKSLWVTGAGRGLGRAIALEAARQGARLVVSARRREDLISLAALLPDTEVVIAPVDVRDPTAVAETVRTAVNSFGGIDGLVNAAGISPVFAPTTELQDHHWADVLATNLTGTFNCCRAAAQVMLDAGQGSIVNLTSVHARHGWPRLAAYAASKGGVAALTKALAVEWAPRGVRVNALVPGYFETDLSNGLLRSHHGERIRQATPLGRTGAPEELVNAATYLLSDAAGFVVGSELTVDGGWSAW